MTDDEKVSAYEDIGGRHDVTGHRPRRPRPEMKRIMYTQGIDKGVIRTIKAAIADDLVLHRMAEYVDREVGEEG